jgi:hypothetical protein
VNDQTPPPPPPPTPAPAPATVPAVPRATGAHRKVRSPAAVVIFSIITFGIYFLVWTYKVFQELKENTSDGVGGVIGLVIALVVYPVNWFLLPSEVGNMYAKAGLDKPVRGVTGFWNLLPLIGMIVWIVKIQGALNRRWEQLGPTQ